jgi:mannitol/fructose-specific phosphotransferase system IIA component
VLFVLCADHILLDQQLSSKPDVLRVIGDVMLASGAVTERYVLGMFQKEAQYGTWVTEGIAMPHGTNEVKSEVLRNTLVLVQMPKGVDWGKGRIVHLAIGFAGKGDDQHMQLLGSLAGILQQQELVDRLIKTQDKDEALAILNQHGHFNQEE